MYRILTLAAVILSFALTSVGNAAPAVPSGHTLYLEAERFDSVGGWTVDAQFRQLMGSTYLLAAGIGEPVADATTTVQVPQASTYYLWVRCKDWDKTSPGAFQVLVNGKPVPVRFGTQKKDWAWIAGGAVALTQGANTLALHDLTGYYGRCDALLLTTDRGFTPPDSVAGTVALRDRLLGRPAPQVLQYDLVVVGGGYAGICTAVQAARLGLKTALLQNRPVLGGNASAEINVGPGGASPHTSLFRETGFTEEIAEGRYHPGSANWSDAAALAVKEVPHLTIYLNTEGTRAVMEGKRRIAAVEAEHVISGQRYLFRAPLFADCTGDGTIAFSAGCAFRHGQEARSEYGESYAPEKANKNTMGTSLLHRSRRMETPQPFTPPPFAVKFTAEHFTRRKANLVNGEWWIEYGGLLDTIQDAEHIRDELIRVVFGAFDWSKNHDPATRDLVTHHKLTWVPTVGGKRESRRFYGDYTLTQGDITSAKLFPDRVAFGGWPIDLHPSEGIYGKEIPSYTPFGLNQVYSIPYRILYARDVDNLFLGGRLISVTHVALGSTRLMQTHGVMGQATGAAAYLCRKYGITPRAVNPAHIGELQQTLLRWDAFIPQMPNEDPGDLCRTATMTASSVTSLRSGMVGTDPRPGKDAPCTQARGQVVTAVGSGQKSVSLWLLSKEKEPVVAELRVEKGDPTRGATTPLWSVTATVKPGSGYQWITFAFPEALTAEETYFVWLTANPKLTWRVGEGAYGTRTWGAPGSWKQSQGTYMIRPAGMALQLGNTGPSAANDGLKWPMPGQCHQWRSDPAQGLPQWLEADFGKPVPVNTVYLTFDTNIYGRFPSAKPGNEVTAQAYRLLYRVGDTWKVAFEEKDNWRRFRRYQFPTVTTDKIRLEILDARNGKEARVYEMRAYNE